MTHDPADAARSIPAVEPRGATAAPARPAGALFRPGLATYAVLAFGVGFAGDAVRNLVSWWGYLAVVAVLAGIAVRLIATKRPRLRWTHLPMPLVLFLGWCLASVIWSWYRPETLLGSLAQCAAAAVGCALAIRLTKQQFIEALGRALRWIIGLSLAFELVVAIFFPGGVLPIYLLIPGQIEFWAGVSPDQIHPAFYWSQGHLFDGAAIQGISGNRNLLGMQALLGLVVTSVQLAAGRLGRWRGWIWVVVCLGMLFLSRSATPIVILPVLVLVVGLIWLARRLTTPQRWLLYLAVAAVAAVGAVVLVIWRDEIFGLINRSGDLSGRGTVWEAVVGLGGRQPVVGIGWMGYWAPWVPVFQQLVILDGLRYLQAHNAYLDVWLQTGVIGLVLFTVLVLTTAVRTWWLAIDRPQTDASGPRPIPRTAVLGVLLVVALALQALTESRLLTEGNWMLLCYLAIYSKLRVQDLPELPRRTPSPRTRSLEHPARADEPIEAPRGRSAAAADADAVR